VLFFVYAELHFLVYWFIERSKTMKTRNRRIFSRKALAIIVAVAMVLTVAPMTASADNPGDTLPYRDISNAQPITFGVAAEFGTQNPAESSSSTQWGKFDITVPSIVTVKVDTPAPPAENGSDYKWSSDGNKLEAKLYAYAKDATDDIDSYSLYDGEATVSTNSKTVTKSATSKFKVLPGTYYIRAAGYWNGYGLVTVTSEAVSFSAVDKEYNNTKVNAQAIAFNTAYTGLIGYAGLTDTTGKLLTGAGYDYDDYYKFTVPKDGTAVKFDFSRPDDGVSRGYSANIQAGEDVTSYWVENGQTVWPKTGDTISLTNSVSGSTTANLGKGTYYVHVGGGWGKAGEYTIQLTNYNLTVAAKKSIAKGKSFDLGAKSTPAIKLYYKSSDTKIADVDVNGKVKAKKAGSAIITVYAGSQGSAFYKECKVTVTSLPTKIKLKATSKVLLKGKSFALKVKTWTPAKAFIAKADQKLKFTSSNKKVATVSATGKVTAKKKGTATITVKTVNGKTAKCKVTVQ
jgi:hypothetical protein